MIDPAQISSLGSPRDRVRNHLVALRHYASRVIVLDELLEIWEDDDRTSRLEDYFDAGKALNLTQNLMAKMVLIDLPDTRAGQDD